MTAVREASEDRGLVRKKNALLLAEELAHARLPPPALVQRDASELGAATGEPGALPAEHVDELLLAQVAHLLHVLLVILQAEIDVGLHAAELDRGAIVRPDEEVWQRNKRWEIAAIGGELKTNWASQRGEYRAAA
jgi:hypothetical protein